MKIDWGKTLTSWTVWANAFAILLQVIDFLMVSPVIPKEYLPYFSVAQGMINILLRFKTNDSLLKS